MTPISVPAIVVIHFAIVKNIVRRCLKISNTHFLNLLVGLICLLVLPVKVFFLMPFVIFRLCLFIALKITYGKQYGGLLKGNDSLFELYKEKAVINMVVIYSCGEDTYQRIEKLKKFITKIHNSSYKFSCTIERIFGYWYLVKNRVEAHEILHVVNVNEEASITETMLYDYIHQNCSDIKQNYMWQAHGLLQPLQWNTSNEEINKQRYALVLTFRHSCGDAPSIIGSLKKFLKADFVSNKESEIAPYKKITIKSSLTLKDACIHCNPLTKRMEGRNLEIQGRSDSYLMTFIEPNPGYFQMIRFLKKKSNVSFTDVLGAAIYTSVRNHILQRQVKTNTITGHSIVRVYSKEMEEIINGTYNYENPINTSSALTYEFPWDPADRCMKDRILSFHRMSKLMENTVDYMVPYTYCRDVLSYMPSWFGRFVANRVWDGSHFYLSNLVGFPKCSFEGYNIEEFFFCCPSYCYFGFVFCIFSYDNRLAIAATTSKGHVYSKEELQMVLNNAIGYLEEANEEILQLETKHKE